MDINVYINLKGNYHEGVEFYAEVFGVERWNEREDQVH